MPLELIKATLAQKPILANLLELYAYDFTEFRDFDIDENGLYGYKPLPLYWIEPNRFPYLIYIDKKIVGFIFVQKGSPISNEPTVWNIAEFFVLKKYKRHGIGTAAALKIWEQFKGRWQVSIVVGNQSAQLFWPQAIEKFTQETVTKTEIKIKKTDWIVYEFESKDKG